MELLRGRVELWVVLVALSAIGQANGMSKKYTFDEGCNATNCPPTYIGDIFGWEQDRYAMCLDATVCRCEAPFAGPNCENWFKTDDAAHLWGNIVVYAFEVPVLIYLLVGSFLILMRKLKRREEAANKLSTQVLRNLSGVSKGWFKRKTGLIVTSAAALITGITLYLLKLLVDPYYTRGVWGRRTGKFMVNFSYSCGFVSFIQLFGAYSKIVLKTKRGKKKAECCGSGRTGIVQRRRYLRRTCLFLLFLRLLHDIYVNIMFHHLTKAYILSANLGNLLFDMFSVFVFTSFTLLYGFKLIREVKRIAGQLDRYMVSMARTKSAKVRARNKSGTRYMFVLHSMKFYLFLLGVAGALTCVAGLIRFLSPATATAYLCSEVALNVPLMLILYSLMRLLEGKADSDVNNLLSWCYGRLTMSCWTDGRKSLRRSGRRAHGSVETLNPAFGVDESEAAGNMAQTATGSDAPQNGDSDESGSDFFLGDSDEDEGAATDSIGLSNSIRGDVELSDVERTGRESTD